MNEGLELKNKLDIKNKVFTKNHKEPKKIKIKVLCNHSVNNKGLYFTNFLDRKELNNRINSQVSNILKNDGKEVSSEDIPFDLLKDSKCGLTEYLRHNDDENRIPAILSNYGVKFENEAILKCCGKSCLEHEIAGSGIPGDTVRVFVMLDIKSNEWNVVLIDPYHLVATERYIENYDIHKNNKVDISELEPLF